MMWKKRRVRERDGKKGNDRDRETAKSQQTDWRDQSSWTHPPWRCCPLPPGWGLPAIFFLSSCADGTFSPGLPQCLLPEPNGTLLPSLRLEAPWLRREVAERRSPCQDSLTPETRPVACLSSPLLPWNPGMVGNGLPLNQPACQERSLYHMWQSQTGQLGGATRVMGRREIKQVRPLCGQQVLWTAWHFPCLSRSCRADRDAGPRQALAG